MNCTHQIKKNDMGNTCSSNEGEVHIGFCWENRRETNDLEDLGMDGRVILNSKSRKSVWNMDWIDLAEDRDKWNALVKAAMDMPVQ
jgi:hypothetical protein